MAQLVYQKVAQKLLKELPPRQKEVIERRFGLTQLQRETLAQIGQDYGVCRERIRQIQNQALRRLEIEIRKQQRILVSLKEEIEKWGGLKREDKLIENLGGEKIANSILFLLHLGDSFEKKREDEEFYTLWLTDRKALLIARKTIRALERILEKEKTIFSFEELLIISQKKIFTSSRKINENFLFSFLEATKKIEEAPTGGFGLSVWPEVNPRGVKDKAYLVLKKAQKPLHFQEVAQLIDEFFYEHFSSKRNTLPQTVHNELIKDPRFVLVGRGLYALKEWGFTEGTVKDIILKVLQEKNQPLSKEEILKEVKKQRIVKENTILLNLADKKYFKKTSEGKYILK